MSNDPLGLLDEEDDPLGLGLEDEGPKSMQNWLMNPEDDRQPKDLKHDFEQMGPLRQIGELAVGVPEAIVSLGSTIPAFVAGGFGGLSGLALGEGLEGASNRAKQEMERFTYTPRSTGGQLLVHDAGQAYEKVRGTYGDIEAAKGSLLERAGIPGAENLYRTGGEAGFDAAATVSPLGGALKGIRGQRQAGEQARGLLDQKMRGEAEYTSWEAEQAKNVEYQKALTEMDTVMQELDANGQVRLQKSGKNKGEPVTREGMVRYPKDYQAPQLGMGGKVAKHADQQGKREGGVSQMWWDEEMRKHGEEHQAFRDQAHEAALERGVDQIGQYEPTTKGTTLEHAPSPVRPFQIEQQRPSRISEGEATQIYLKPKFERTLEDNLKLREYEESLREPDLSEVKTEVGKSDLDTSKIDAEVDKHLQAYLNGNNGARGRSVEYDRDGNPIDFPYKEGGYAFTEFKKDLDARGIKISDAAAKAMYDNANPEPVEVKAHPKQDTLKVAAKIPGLERIRREYKDDRPWDEILSESQKFGDVWMLTKHGVAKILGGKFTNTDHPLWSKVSSFIHETKHQSMQSSLSRLHGKSRKHPDPGTYNYVWKQLTAKEREAVNDLGWKHNNSDTSVSSSDLASLSPKQREAYTDRIRINKQVLADINKALVDEGKDPIPELPNYWSPIILDHPFIVKFKDKTGDTKKIAGFYLKPDEAKLQKFAAEHDMTAELQSERGIRGEMDFEQFEWILRQLGKEQRDPASRAITEGLRRQGFMRHGLKRKGVEGGAGSLGGRKGLREYEEVSEKYIRRAYEYISNRQLDKMYKQILDEKSLDSMPRAKAFALEAIDTARGGANSTFEGFSKAVGDIVSGTVQLSTLGQIKLPNRFARDLLRMGNKTKTTLLLGLGNLTNIAANGLQAWTYAPPQMLALAAKAGQNSAQMTASVFKAMVKTGSDMMQWDNNKDIQKLREIGALEATFKYDWSTYASDKDPRYSSTVAEHLTGISLLSKVEADAVRRPAALMFLNMLREIGYDKVAKDKNEIYYVAKEMTDKYMVSTRHYEKPHVFSRTGIVGTAISPLQSFTTTWLGMMREYAKLSTEGLLEGSVAKQIPLGVFLAMNVTTAGLLGLIGIKEWDAIATKLNNWFGYNIPTGTEYIMSKVKSTKWRFGLLSDAVGFHIGATFNAPTLTGSFAPGMQMLGDVGNFGMQMGKQYGKDVLGVGNAPTAVDKREAWKGITPRFNWMTKAIEATGGPEMPLDWGNIEKKYTPPGAPYQDMAGNAGPITRTDKDWQARKMGTYTLDEAEQKTENYIGKKKGDERSKRLSKAIERMADTIVMDPTNSDIMDKIEPMIQSLEGDQFTGRDIKNALRRELLNKMVESDVRMMGKGRSSRQAYIAKILEELR